MNDMSFSGRLTRATFDSSLQRSHWLIPLQFWLSLPRDDFVPECGTKYGYSLPKRLSERLERIADMASFTPYSVLRAKYRVVRVSCSQANRD